MIEVDLAQTIISQDAKKIDKTINMSDIDDLLRKVFNARNNRKDIIP